MESFYITDFIRDYLLDNISIQISVIEELQEIRAYEAVPKLLKLLNSQHSAIKDSVIHALGTLGVNEVETVARALVCMLKDPDGLVRSSAIESLTELNYKPALKNAIHLLENDNESIVRIVSIEMIAELSSLGSRDMLNSLNRSMLHDDDILVRSYSAWAIGNLGTKEYIQVLQKGYKSEKFYLPKLNILAAAYRLGDQESLTKILSIFKDVEQNEVHDLLKVIHELIYSRIPTTLVSDVRRICDVINQSMQLLLNDREYAEEVISDLEKYVLENGSIN